MTGKKRTPPKKKKALTAKKAIVEITITPDKDMLTDALVKQQVNLNKLIDIKNTEAAALEDELSILNDASDSLSYVIQQLT